jgi:hypothetical protein
MKPPLPGCQPLIVNRARISTCSKPEEIGNCDEHNSDRNEQNRVGYEVGKDHQRQATDQWDNSLLFPTIDEKAQPD